MNEQVVSDAEDGGAAPAKSGAMKNRLIGVALVLGGMIAGALIEIGVQVGVESTGVLGPSVEALMDEQKSNFADVNAKLAELRKSSSDPEVRRQLAELGAMLERQGELAGHASAELAYLTGQVSELKDQALADQGYASGADFWLKPGESVTVGDRNQVLGLLNQFRNVADVNLNGQRTRMAIGDVVDVPLEAGSCKVYYKQATRRADGRVGFDLTCS